MARKYFPGVNSTRLLALAPLVALALVTACSGGTGGTLPATGASSTTSIPSSASGLSPSTAVSATANTLASTRAVAAQKLPPQGVYNSCEIDTALSNCEQQDAQMASTGFKWEINYIGLAAHKTGPDSLQAWFTYDASIGLGQVINVDAAINDPVNVLTGDRLITNFDNSLANDCGATNNEQIIACISEVAKSVPGFHFKWYLYDEPGCPNQSIGYCAGTLAGGNYQNVQTLANYIKSLTPDHDVIGTNSGDGANAVGNLYSWLMGSSTPVTGFDYYPVPSGGNFGTIDNIGSIAGALANTVKSTYANENIYYVAQAFSWYQANGNGCTSISACPFPTTSQLQDMRDQALYYSNQSGVPLSMIFWWAWPDVTCEVNYPGCNASANLASLKSAAFAPYPVEAPI
jgi:hypothetical protein